MDARLTFHDTYSQLFFSRVLEGLSHQGHGVQCGHTVTCLKAGTRNNSTVNIVLLSEIDARDFTNAPNSRHVDLFEGCRSWCRISACRPRGGPGQQVRCCTHASTKTAAMHGYHLLRLAKQALTSPPAVVEVLPIDTAAFLRRHGRYGLRR